jgi:signal transduction histidine kinase
MANKRHTILVVDDEADVVKSVQDLLRMDYKVLGTTRAKDALQIMQQEEVHVVMSDQRMPEMTGVEFLHRVRGGYPEAIRLLFTGYADIRAVIDAINQGNVYRYITKPWDPDELQTVIREAVERYDLITDKNRLTEELKSKNAELESANSELRKSLELKTAFIRVASHELRTPVAILSGLTKLLAIIPEIPESVAEWLPRLDAATLRLQHLVDQLIGMLSAGKYTHTLEIASVDVAALLTQAADDVRPFTALRKQTLAQKFTADLGTIQADRAKLRDALNELLLNAVKFTPDGGTVTLSACRTTDAGIEIIVTDTGAGMDADSIKRLFEPFFTGFDVSHHSSGTYEFGRKGIGLGLSTVKAFVELHGGTVTGSSEPGKGSTFTIHLPALPGLPLPQRVTSR